MGWGFHDTLSEIYEDAFQWTVFTVNSQQLAVVSSCYCWYFWEYWTTFY
jgi:hypothetical protein